MYRLLLMLAFSLAAVTSVHAALETPTVDNSAVKEYQKLLGNYYFLDKQKAGHIECSVSDTLIQDLIDKARQKEEGKLIVNVNLHDFSFVYDRIKGASFNFPHIKLSFSPDTKFVKDENVREKLEETLNGIMDKAKKSMDKPLAFMFYPEPEDYKNLSLTKNGNDTVVSFDDNRSEHYTLIYSGSKMKETASSSTLNQISAWDYQSLNGKLALVHMATETTEGSTKGNAIETVSYQNLGSIFVPAQTLLDGTVSEGTQQPHSLHREIDFKNCKASDVSP